MLYSNHFPALTRPKLVAGIGFKTCGIVWGLGLITALLVGFPWGFVPCIVALITHAGLVWAYRKDDKILDVMKMHDAVSNHYAGSSGHQDSGLISRPKGFGKGFPC